MPAGATYEPLATTTLTSAQSSITFSSISGSYTDLRVVLSGKSSSNLWWGLRFNSDTGSNYAYIQMRGNGGGTAQGSTSNSSYILLNEQAQSVITAGIYDIFSYANTATHKVVLGTYSGDASGSGIVQKTVGRWRSTSAITTVELWMTSSATYDIDTMVTIYGITRA